MVSLRGIIVNTGKDIQMATNNDTAEIGRYKKQDNIEK